MCVQLHDNRSNYNLGIPPVQRLMFHTLIIPVSVYVDRCVVDSHRGARYLHKSVSLFHEYNIK